MSQSNNTEQEKIKRHRSFKETVSHNFGLKVLSLVFAILLWCYVVSETNPVRGITYSDVKINVTGLTELAAQRLIPSELLRTRLPQVRVTLNVPYRELSNASSSVVDVSLDLSGITGPGSYEIPLRVKSGSSDITVASFSPSAVEVEIEELSEAVVPVSIKTTGSLADNLYKGQTVADPERLRISGPASYISRITQAQITVDLSVMTDGYAASMQYEYIDKNGNPVSGENITADQDAVLVDMGILSKKTVPVEYLSGLVNSDKLQTGYEVSEAVISVPSVTVVGKEQELRSVDKIYIKDIDLTGLGPETSLLKAELIVPDGVRVLESQQQEIDIIISEKRVTKTFEISIDYLNNAGKTVSASVYTAKVTVNGGYFALENIREQDVTVTADTTALGTGTHSVKLTASLRYSNPLVTVSIEPSSVMVIVS